MVANFLSLKRPVRTILLITGLISVTTGSSVALATDPTLPPALQKLLQKRKIPRDTVSIVVQEIGEATDPVLALNGPVPRNPASTLKLLTTFVALDVLGPTYTWPTKLYADGAIKNGILDGDLVIKGHGDPFLVVEEFWKMLGELKRRGVTTIDGDIVIDDTYFSIPELDPGAFDNEPYRLYNVIPNAAMVNFKATEFIFSPNADGKTVRIETRPELPKLKINNKLSIVQSACQGYRMGIRMDVPNTVGANEVTFSGAFPSACRSYSLYRSVVTHSSYLFSTFTRLWQHWGGSVTGTYRYGPAPKRRPIVVWRSPPLAEIIRAVNKWSNNVMTRLLIYSIALSKFEPPVTREQGIEVVHDYLQKHQLDDSSLVIDNGSGLSRTSRISADLMNSLLRHAYRDPYMPEFIASMSINGFDGTTRRRFKGKPLAGRMHLKTGRLDNVAAIAGYVVAASGKTYSVVLMVNHTNVHNGPGIELQNALLKWVYDQ